MALRFPEQYHIQIGEMATRSGNGAFYVPGLEGRSYRLFVIASVAFGWEHVSVSLRDRTPTWEEMCRVKALFWEEEDCVIQYHPPASEYVNNHDHVLHLWRPLEAVLPLPDSIFAGLKNYSPDQLKTMTAAQLMDLMKATTQEARNE